MAAVEERHLVPIPGGALAMVLHRPTGGGDVACVVACHGLQASKDSDKYLMLGAACARVGLALARFDFQGCGESSGVEAETTVATRIADAEAVLAHLGRLPGLDARFGLLGSSLGGFVAIHVSARRPGGFPLVTWNAPASLLRLAEDVRPDRAGLGPPFLAELAGGVYAEAPAGAARHLVVQGEADDVVPLAHGVALHERALAPRGLVVIPGGDHRLTDPEHRGKAVAESLAWLRRFLVP